MALVLDTGPLLAAFDAGDPDHERCADLLTDADEDLIVPGLVLGELDYWCRKRLAPDVWAAFVDDLLEGAYRYEPPTLTDLQRSRDLQRTYEDLVLGVVDASIIALLERLGEEKLGTFDHRHFGVVRPAHADAVRLLP